MNPWQAQVAAWSWPASILSIVLMLLMLPGLGQRAS
jgi:hypothetical protein